MRTWTIQAPVVLAALRDGKVWRADTAHVASQWVAAYRWMAREMHDRLGAPASPAQPPIWLWCQWRGSARPMPDLRYGGHLPKGASAVRIELELDDDRVLRSDFDLWHYVLNGWYLPSSRADEGEFDARPYRRRVAPSWRRIFDLEWCDRRYVAAREAKSIQGTTWELRPEDVRRSTAFTAR